MKTIVVKGLVSGRVQGVGFRYFVQKSAQRNNIHGYAKNLADGRVEVLLCGEEAAVWEVQKAVLKGPLLSEVTGCKWHDEDLADIKGFRCL